MKTIENLRKIRLNIAKEQAEREDVLLWTSLWTSMSGDLRNEVARQIIAGPAKGYAYTVVEIDDPLLIAELVSINSELLDASGSPVTYASVNSSVRFMVLPRAVAELQQAPEVRVLLEELSQSRAADAVLLLEATIRESYPDLLRQRVRSRFIIDGIVWVPGSLGSALEMTVFEPTGHVSRMLMPVRLNVVQSVQRIVEPLDAFPSIVLTLGSRAEGCDIQVVPQIGCELQRNEVRSS